MEPRQRNELHPTTPPERAEPARQPRRLGARALHGGTVAATQRSRARNALECARSSLGCPLVVTLFLRRGPWRWLYRLCDDQAVLLLGDRQVPFLGLSLPVCTKTERTPNISETLFCSELSQQSSVP